MAKFDLDDPLGDLLSDGSDDSFFDEPKKRPIAKSPDKKTVSDLFGLEEDKEKDKGTKDDWLGLDTTNVTSAAKKSKSITSPKTTRPRTGKKISFEDEEDTGDFLSNLGLDSKTNKQQQELKSKINTTKKSSVMESLMGTTKDDKKSFSLDDLLQETKALKKETEVTQSATQLTQSKPVLGMHSSENAPREGRRGRARSANISDPLGLFETNKDVEPPRRQTPNTQTKTEDVRTEILFQESKSKSDPNIAEVPDWLGGSSNRKATEMEKTKSLPSQNHQARPTPSEETIAITANPSLDSLMTQQKLTASNIEYQNASMALQQQESQLLMALQLKKYEDNLGDLQRKQQEVLVKQEHQFNSLLERQFAKQQIMENNMRLQQERINNHIQMLLGQPSIASNGETMEKIEEIKKGNVDEVAKQYEDIINHLKQRQHEEMFLLEESYKKQLSTIEQSMESVENHLKMELDASAQKHREKLEGIDLEHKGELEKYQKKIEELHKNHEIELKQLRENNNRVVEEIKYEYNTIIENLKASRDTEQSILNNGKDFSEKLTANLQLLDINSRSLSDIREKVISDHGILTLAREESIKAKQKEIELMRQALEKARELADKERAELMSLVRNLEIKLAEQSDNSREERFALQQAAATLSSRTAALDREAEFNRKSIEREREQLKTLRETILAEQEKSMQEITEEKLSLHAEKVRVETAAKLGQNFDALRAKAEVDAALQVAQDATALTDKERENLVKQIREVETLKRSLLDRESRLNSRERDLEMTMEHANCKSLMGEKALNEARILQMNYNDKLREIQAQIASINSREKKLAEDKIAISRERLALHNSEKQMKKCGLCAVDNVPRLEEEDDMVSEPVEHDIPRFISASDADIFRLQLQMSEEQLTSTYADDRSVNNLTRL